jgi:hypothetical protein
MLKTCIYCGKEATTKDHVPPKCFFPTPRPDNLLTVPCCESCNKIYGKDDERARNLLTSLEATEHHEGIIKQLAGKRNRSFQRLQGRSNLDHMVRSMVLVDTFSTGAFISGNTTLLI